MANVTSKIDHLISEHSVMIFSKSLCPFCTKVKDIFRSLGVEYFAYELDKEEDGEDIQAALLAKSGQRTVPNVFVNGTHVGGCDDTKAAHTSGKLRVLLSGTTNAEGELAAT